MAELLSVIIQSIGLKCQIFTSAREFLLVVTESSDIILLDLNMPDVDGIEVIRIMAQSMCESRLILISGHDKGVLHSAQQLAQAHELNVIDSLTKPIQIERLQHLIKTCSHEGDVNKRFNNENNLIPEISELELAIKNHEFILHYQPQLDLKTNKLRGAEALIRWQHPDRGLLYPDLFIPLAEKSGLIGDLTALVIAMSMEQSSRWQEQNLFTQVSVNISAINITSLSLPEQLSELLQGNRLDPNMLILEVTESALMGELVTSLDILTRLRMKGFGLSIDDFGTGYSSLSQLHRIPFTELKIDKSFVMSMNSDDDSRAIVKTCILLGHELNMEVVAEGVESQEIYDNLKVLGCDIAQGYHIAKPMPANELLDWSNLHDVVP